MTAMPHIGTSNFTGVSDIVTTDFPISLPAQSSIRQSASNLSRAVTNSGDYPQMKKAADGDVKVNETPIISF